MHTCAKNRYTQSNNQPISERAQTESASADDYRQDCVQGSRLFCCVPFIMPKSKPRKRAVESRHSLSKYGFQLSSSTVQRISGDRESETTSPIPTQPSTSSSAHTQAPASSSSTAKKSASATTPKNFQESWRNEFHWLYTDTEGAMCLTNF